MQTGHASADRAGGKASKQGTPISKTTPRPTSADASAPPAVLVLEDGSTFGGTAFGAQRAVGGEVVFNTGMASYIETLTDPSYRGQILTLTYPLVGNYGVPPAREAASIAPPFESDRIQVQGLVIQRYMAGYSHFAATRSLGQWLHEGDVPGLTGIDTRTLTRRLRERGTMRGWILPGSPDDFAAQEHADAVDMHAEVFDAVAPAEPVLHEGGELRVMLIDIGAKDNIVRSLLERGATVDRVPWHHELEAHAASAHGILIGNGPGDPKDLGQLIERIRRLLAAYTKPVFGICLGNQLLALAAGGDTYKLPYGHRGVNQPVQDLLSRRCYVTSQNHGYAVRDEALPSDWESWFVNVNDGTNEGVRSRVRPHFSVQFHPEASPGPEEAGFLFDDFLRIVGAMRTT